MTTDRQDWVKQKLKEAVAERLESLQATLDGQNPFEVDFRDGELILHAGGRRVLDRIYLDEGLGSLVAAYWRLQLLSQTWRDASALAAALRRPPAEANSPAARQFSERVEALWQQVGDLGALEREINERLFALYDLSEAERFLVETDARGRP